jgi:L-fucose isomerase-like protein
MRLVAEDHAPEAGEVLFAAEATEAELAAAFPGHATARAAVEAAGANAALRTQLDALDAKSVRPLRAVLAATQAGATPDPADLAKLAAIEAQAQSLRGQISG